MEADRPEKGLNRRKFLQITALTGAGLAGAGSLLRLPSLYAQAPPAAAAAAKCDQLIAASEKIPITTSIFELFKIGPGPSSSHTIAPMRAANDFMAVVSSLNDQTLASAQSIEVRLFGSLSATGKGHGTDWAILAGILGQKPETCAPEFLDALKKNPNAVYQVRVGKKDIPVSDRQIIFDKLEHGYPFSNTIIMRLRGDKGILLEKEYYSIGGGFIQWKGWTEPKRGTPAYPYGTMDQLKELLDKDKIPLHRLVLENEKAIMGMGEAEIYTRLDLILADMEASVKGGMKGEGVLPGPIGLYRKAGELNSKARKIKQSEARFLLRLSAYAIAGAEAGCQGEIGVAA
ncbi:MAG: L-serine dehydratase, partial [Thermodesulfobacteriota bacterium]|nr:L-serine dehydratase [Thermodesulfobacteriota bacterium]